MFLEIRIVVILRGWVTGGEHEEGLLEFDNVSFPDPDPGYIDVFNLWYVHFPVCVLNFNLKRGF